MQVTTAIIHAYAPSHRVLTVLLISCDSWPQIMVANIRCAEIAADQLRAFTEDQAWQALVGQAMAEGAGVQRGVNSRVASLLESCVAGWVPTSVFLLAIVLCRAALPVLIAALSTA